MSTAYFKKENEKEKHEVRVKVVELTENTVTVAVATNTDHGELRCAGGYQPLGYDLCEGDGFTVVIED